jgi:hypothetical protein
MGVLVAVPLAALARRPTVAAAQHAAVVVVAFVVAAGAARMFDPAVVIFPALIGLLLYLHPRRAELFRAGRGFSVPLGVLAAAVTVPSLWYGWSEIQLHLAAPLTDPHRGPPEAHYVTSAALVLRHRRRGMAGVAAHVRVAAAGLVCRIGDGHDRSSVDLAAGLGQQLRSVWGAAALCMGHRFHRRRGGPAPACAGS